MQKLAEVETAKALLNEATTWSVMKWLREKKSVRKTADLANAALDQLGMDLRQRWPEDIQAAYEAQGGERSARGSSAQNSHPAHSPKNGDALRIAKKLKQVDEEAYRARMDAEQTFELAEKQLSTRLAREGCHKAILSWDLKEKALRCAEEAAAR